MATPLKFGVLLLLSTAFVAPAAIAQEAKAVQESDNTAPAADGQEQAAPDISIPGGDIVVTGRRNANVQQAAPAVVLVLSTADIARTGEGNIAGALGRVTGLSVVGNGFVYVRGLGDRYSLALLNGLPLPSPEPLKRSIPLDLFPTNIVSSSLVQKSYSVNFPGEFGGGVVNLTTSVVPQESFLTATIGGSFHSETTGINGYTYYGSKTDWTGFDNGTRNTPAGLAAYYATGLTTSQITNEQNRTLAGSLVTPSLSIAQRDGTIPPNFSGSLSAGTSFELGSDAALGLIATAGFSNKWQTRDAIQQFSSQDDLGFLNSNFERVTTTDRSVANGLLGVGLEFGDNKIRTTALYIRDTLKSTRIGIGTRSQGATFQVQDTAWYERQLIDTQLVGEFKPFDGLSVDLRASYANSQREAPAETSFEYFRTGNSEDPYGNLYQISLTGNVGNRPRIAFSDLNEDLWAAGGDVTYKLTPDISLGAGYYYQVTRRTTVRREFQLNADNSTPTGVLLLRPDILFSPGVINAVGPGGAINPYGIEANEVEPNPAWSARLKNHAGYGKINWQLIPGLTVDAGVRYERAFQRTQRIQVFLSDASVFRTALKNDYWLPAGTVTWEFQPAMQLRFNASKTIARPQFRELVLQPYFDPETNRTYTGNPFLTDSKLTNFEGRYEWYFDRDQRLSVAGFYKTIDRPIEAYLSLDSSGNSASTFFANAPKASLYGVEVDVQKYFNMSDWFAGDMFAARRLVTIANYTYTKSKLKVASGDTTIGANGVVTAATAYFKDGSSLTGQSDHIVNFQLGMENTDRLSQQTFILSYASQRVTSRGVSGDQPDVFEHPGFNLDFVWREGVLIGSREVDLKAEVRNILYNKYREYQELGDRRVYYNFYNIGTTFSLSASLKF
ncbi:TonB-dependent receptor domain-containing protein [Sphingobium sp. B12D2B]|uniref:TonB-dependent receptor domain-containing protein n=1 Tax=Sphingobium sp. B12D2B TaxID=2940577 RepID=UPI002224D19F|nr:TonB-dependent receptor [Sphingobium sp. B12D2B]MCW2349775.1 TonB-dependent receptor [Sphingobium sp. B12D2B]